MPIQDQYTQILNLANLDVYLETEPNDDAYFSISGLPEVIGYGKHFFTLTYKDPPNSPLLATNSTIVFEFVDSNGTVVFSELADIPDVSGAATGYIWIKDDPLRTAENIFDGEMTMYVVGTLDGVPAEFQGLRNLRSSFTFDIRKNTPNLSPIMIYDTDAVVQSASFIETQEEDRKPGYTRGYINVSASHLQTQGGKIAFAELSYRETGSRDTEFTVLNQFRLENSESVFEVTRSAAQGLNPLSTQFKAAIPRRIRRDTPVIFRLRYLDENKTPAQFYDQNRLNQAIEVTSSVIEVNGSPMIIEQEDNLLKGSMYTGQAVGKGFEQSGKSSAYLKTVDYEGFASASQGLAPGGVMFFSGSVLTSSGDDYDGVGLELFANTESFLRFRSNPSELDIRAKAFFVGSRSTQFISASGGIIEISSSKFHLQPDGDVSIAGTVEAETGKIGGFHISESRINSANEKIIFNSIGQISASSLLLASGSFVIDPDNLSRFGSDGFQSFVMAEDTGVKIQTSNFNLNTARFIISSSDVGVMAVGSTPPTAHNSGKGFYVDGDGNLLIGDSTGPRIQFDGFETIISSSTFFLGSDAQFVSGANGNVEISSSNFHLDAAGNVNMAGTITAEAGKLGGFEITQHAITGSNFFISGGAVNNEFFISSSNFNVKASGDITGSQVLFQGGKIAAFNLSKDALSTDSFFISASATGDDLFISASSFNVNAQGIVTASALSLEGGDVGGLVVSEGTISVGEILKLKDSGQVTGSDVLFSGGTIGGFDLSATEIKSSNDNLRLKSSGQITASEANITGDIVANKITANTEGTIANFTVNSAEIKSSNNALRLKSSGQITASNAQIEGKITATAGEIGGFGVSATTISSSNNNLILKNSGQITGSTALFTGGKIAGWTISGTTLVGNNATLDGAGSALFKSDAGPDTDNSAPLDELRNEYYIDFSPSDQGNTRNFFVKFGPNFMVDSEGILIASGAKFSGTITASAGLIGGFTTDSSSLHSTNLFISGSPKVGGTHHPAFMFISSSNFNVKESGDITGSSALFDGDIKVSGTGTIANFVLDSSEIRSSNNNLRLKSSGQITASDANITGDIVANKITANTEGSIANFTINSAEIKSSNNNLRLKSSGQITASDANITGDIVANKITANTEGTIANFTINSTEIKSSNNNLRLKASGEITASKAQIEGKITATAGAIGGFGISATTVSSSNDNLILRSNGQITASNAQLTGKVTATSGEIGGFAITSNAISSSNDKLILRSNGEITGSQVRFTGGKIGGFTLGANTFTATNFELDPSGKRITLGTGNTIFIADGDEGIQLGHATFADAPFSVTTAGVLKAQSGTIGGFTLSANELTATNFTLDPSGKRITLGTGTDIFIADGDDGIQLGHGTFALAPFSVTKAGVLTSTSGTIGGFQIGSSILNSSNNKLILKSTGEITGSEVLFTGGKIGGFTIDADEIKSTNLLLDSNNEKITVGSSNAITIQGGGTDNFIVMGSKTDFAQLSTAGIIMGMDNNVPSFDLTRTSTDYVRFDTTSGVDIKTPNFKLDTTNLDIDSSTSRIQIFDGSANEVVRLGEISNAAGDHFGLKVYDGTGTADSDILVKLGGEGNTIGGWTITTDQIQSQNLVIHSSGRLETGNFVSGLRGWRISADDNGKAEFENVTIRGTLSTAVFEKETVNAVGGQLYVANSTAISASAWSGSHVSASDTTMSVSNVSGFTGSYGTGGEILSLKKVSPTGFTTEYVYVQSASRNDPSSDTDLSGNLYVIRGYGSGTTGASGSLGGSPSSAQSYEEGQVIVSTGRVGTGYIRLNANPNDSATPFMDIVERTGTGVYDVDLKVRVGDLSGLSSATLFGNADPGFGIFTENGFFKGGINATTGSFTGVVHINTSASEIMKLGTNVSGTDDGIHINTHNYWYTTGQFKLGDNTNNIAHDGSGDISITTDNFTLKGGNTLLMNTTKLAFDTSNASTATRTAGTGVFMDTSGNFRVGNASGNRLTFTGTSLELVTDDLNIDTSTFDLSTDSGGKIALGATPPTSHNSGTGFFVDGAGNFLAGNASGNHIKFDATGGTVNVAGTINITGGALAGVTKASISGSANEFSASAASSIAATAQDSESMAARVQLTSTGMNILNASSLKLAEYGANTFIGLQNAEHAKISSTGIELKDNTTVVSKFSSYGAVIGETGGAHISASTVDISVIEDSTHKAVVNSSGLQVHSGHATNTVASFGSTARVGLSAAEHVLIDTTGLSIKDSSTVVGKFSAHGAIIGRTNVGHISASTTDINIIKDSNNKATLGAGGLIISQSGEGVGEFASTTRIGNRGTEHVEITSNSLKLKDATTDLVTVSGTTVTIGNDANNRVQITPTSMQIGSDSGGITFNSDGNATFNGSITIAPGDLPAGTVSGSSQVSDITGSLSGSLSSVSESFAPYQTQVQLDSNGMSLLNADASETLATYGTTVTVGQNANGKSRVFIDNDSVDLIVKSGGGSDTTFASFGATTTVGNASAEHVRIDSDSVDIIQDANNKAVIDASGLTVTQGGAQVAQFAGTTVIGSSDDKITINSSGITLREAGTDTLAIASGVIDLGDTSNEHLNISSTGLLLKDSTDVVGKFVQGGATLGKTAGAHISASTVDVHIIKDASNKAVISADGLVISQSGAGAAKFASTTTIGNTGAEHLLLNTSGLAVKDNTDVVSKFSSHGATLGKTAGAHISASTVDVSIIRNANNKAILSADGLVISQSGAGAAKFAGTTTIGNTGAEHLLLNTSGLSIKDNTTVRASLLNTGVTLNGASTSDQLVVNSSGLTLKQGGNVRATLASNTLTLGKSGKARTVIDDTSISMYSGQATSRKRVAIDNSGKAAFGGAAGADVSVTSTDDVIRITPGEGVSIFEDANNFAVVDSSGLTISQSGAGVAKFAGTTTIGNTGAEHLLLNTTGLAIKDSTDVVSKFSSHGATLGKTAGAHVSASTTDVHIIQDANNKAVVDSGGLTVIEGGNTVAQFAATSVIGSSTDKVTISDSGITIRENNSDQITMASNVITVGSSTDNVKINGTSGVSIKENNVETINIASGVIDVGDTSNEHLRIDTTGLTLKDNTTVVGKFNTHGATIGKTAGAHISASTTDVHIIKDANNKAVLDSDSFDIILNGATSASFGATTTIGSPIGQHVKITNDAFEIKTDADTTVLSASAAGLEMQGTVRANAGEIGGFTIDADEIKAGSTLILDSNSSSGQIKLGAATSLTAGDGIYMDGTGDFRAGDADGNRISFDGTNVQLIADKFFLGGASQFVSGSNSNIEISSSNFHVDRLGNVTANNITGSNILVDGDITATTGVFKDVTVAGVLSRPIQPGAGNLGSVVPGAYFSGSGDKNYVESWFPLNFSKTSGDPTTPVTDFLTCLTGSVWGWSGSIINPGDSQTEFDTLVSFQCLGYEAGVLDADVTNDAGTNLPPRSQFKFVSETEGQSFYESNATSWSGIRSSVDADLKPRMYVEFYPKNPGSGAFRSLKLTSNPLSLPISGSDFTTGGSTTSDGILDGGEGLKELLLEYCVRPVGEFGGFVPTYTTRILKASDDSELFKHVAGGTAAHGQPARWEAISIPMVNSAKLVSFPEGSSAGGVIQVIRDIKIEIEIRADGPSAGGGTPDGFIFTEMRFRKAAFANGLSVNTVNANVLTSYFKPLLENYINVLNPLRISSTDVIDTDLSNGGDKSEYTQIESGSITLAQFSGDPHILFRTRGLDKFTIGVDDSDSDVFKIDSGGSLSDDGDFELTSAGNASFAGDVVAFHTSDKRLKDNIRLIDNPIEKIKKLRGVEYEWNEHQSYYESGSLDSGIIAQDVQKVLPQLVKERKTGYLGVRHDRLVGLLIEAIKEQQVQIEDMKDKIKELEDGSS